MKLKIIWSDDEAGLKDTSACRINSKRYKEQFSDFVDTVMNSALNVTTQCRKLSYLIII